MELYICAQGYCSIRKFWMETPMNGPSIDLVVMEPFMTVTNQVHDCYIQTVKDDKVSLIFVIFPKSDHFMCRTASFLICTSLWIDTLKRGQSPLSPQPPHYWWKLPQEGFTYGLPIDGAWATWTDTQRARPCYEGSPDELLSNMNFQSLPLQQILLS